MRRNFIAGLAAAATVATAFAATSVFGEGSAVDPRPGYATVDVQMGPAGAPAPAKAAAVAAKKARKPKVVYLSGEGTVNTDPAVAGGTGPYIDFRLNAPKNLCQRVIDAGINAGNLDLFQQGSYVRKGEYHVLMGLDDTAAATPVTFPYESHVICLKGVK